mmetsp:Transcript_4345/g.9389  ORF Transcript_4345/g.9389 Transcript_4345/m.9389 type:complete len:959 (-) Transcript_4345:712-3588(-)
MVEDDAVSDSGFSSASSLSDAAQEAALATLEASVVANPSNCGAHVELIEKLREAGELERLREARKRFASSFSLREIDWLHWIEDEARIGGDVSSLSHNASEALPYSVALWELRLKNTDPAQHKSNSNDPEDQQQNTHKDSDVRDESKRRMEMQKAARTAGFDVRKGVSLWNTWQIFEEACQSGRNAGVPPANPSKELEDFLRERAECPILDAGLKAAMLRLNLPQETADEIVTATEEQRRISIAADAFERRIPQQFPEVETMTAADPAPEGLASLWMDYIDAMQQHLRKLMAQPWAQRFIQSLYERAVEMCRTQVELWEAYIGLCKFTLRDLSLAETVAERALTHCHGSVSLWRARLVIGEQRAEDAQALVDQIASLTFRAMQDGLNSSQAFCDVLLASCHSYRRFATAKGTNPELQEQLVKQFEYAESVVATMFPADHTPRLRIVEDFSRCLCMTSIFKDSPIVQDCIVKSAERWDALIEAFPDMVGVYMKAISFFQVANELTRCRKLYKRALYAAKTQDDASASSSRSKNAKSSAAALGVARAWEDFEARWGTLETLESAQLQVSRTLSLRARAQLSAAAAVAASTAAQKGKGRVSQKGTSKPGNKKRGSGKGQENENKGSASKSATAISRKDSDVEMGEDASTSAGQVGEKRKAQEASAQVTFSSNSKDSHMEVLNESLAKKARVEDNSETDASEVKPLSGLQQIVSTMKTSDNQPDQQDDESDSKAAKREAERKRSIFVVNLSYKSTEEAIRNHFETCGKVARVFLKRNAHGQFKGQCTVVYKAQPMADAAFTQLQNVPLDGRALQLLEVRPPGERKTPAKEVSTSTPILSAGEARRTVHITGLPPLHCTMEALQNGTSDFARALQACGSIENVRIADNHASADVCLSSASEAEKALELHKKTYSWTEDSIDSTTVSVQPMRTKYTAPTPTPAPAAPMMLPRALRTKQKKRLDI